MDAKKLVYFLHAIHMLRVKKESHPSAAPSRVLSSLIPCSLIPSFAPLTPLLHVPEDLF